MLGNRPCIGHGFRFRFRVRLGLQFSQESECRLIGSLADLGGSRASGVEDPCNLIAQQFGEMLRIEGIDRGGTSLRRLKLPGQQQFPLPTGSQFTRELQQPPTNLIGFESPAHDREICVEHRIEVVGLAGHDHPCRWYRPE